jgi:hypothetical protein
MKLNINLRKIVGYLLIIFCLLLIVSGLTYDNTAYKQGVYEDCLWLSEEWDGDPAGCERMRP